MTQGTEEWALTQPRGVGVEEAQECIPVVYHLLKSERNKGANDDSSIQNVPQVTAIRARVEQDAQVNDLQREPRFVKRQ